MICKRCSTENSEDAVFCRKCGNRLDGKKLCSACGALNDEEANYCIACGKKISDKEVCSACFTEFCGEFCPQCGRPARPVPAATPVPKIGGKTAAPRASSGKWRRIVEIVGGACAMAGVFFALLFTFFIGLTANSAGETSSVGIFDYFGKSYTELTETLEALNNYDENFELFQRLDVVLGTILVAAILVCVLLFTALAIVRYVRKLTGKSDKDFAGYATAAVLSFLAGAVAFRSYHYAVISAAGIETGAVFNGATVSGIVLSCIFLAFLYGCRIAVNAKSVYRKKQLVPFCLSAGGVLLFALVLHFGGLAIATLNMGGSGYSLRLSGGYNALIQPVLMQASAAEIVVIEGQTVLALALSFVGIAVQIALVVLCVCTLGKFMKNLSSDEDRSNLALAIATEALAVAHLVFAVVSAGEIVTALGIADTAHPGYALPIVTLILSTLALALTIVHKVFHAKSTRENEPTEQTDSN